MVQLVSLPEVKQGLRIDGDDEDPALVFLIEAASEAVIAYLKAGADGFIEDGELIPDVPVPDRVRAATIYWIGVMRRNPDNDTEGAYSFGFPPLPVVALLHQMRDPACA